MKQLLTFLLLIITCGAYSQTYDNLPSGFVPYGTQYYKNPGGKIIVGTSAGKFRVVSQQKELDSLLNLKAPVSPSGSYVQASPGTVQNADIKINGEGTFGDITSGGLTVAASENPRINLNNTTSGYSLSNSGDNLFRINGNFGNSELFAIKQDGSLIIPQQPQLDGAATEVLLRGANGDIRRKALSDFTPSSGSANYIRNNNTGSPQAASANINGTFKVDNANGTSYILGGIGSFSTTAGVTSIDGGAISAKSVGAESLNASALSTLSATTFNGLATLNGGFRSANSYNYLVGSATFDFSPDGTQSNNIKIKAPSSFSGSYEQQIQAASGTIALLDGSGKLPIANMPDALVGAVVYQGNYDVPANSPALPLATGNKGKYYVVSVGGTTQGNTFENGDWIISNGSAWQKVDNSTKVASVNGLTGAVVLTKSSIELGNVDNTSDPNKPVSTATQMALNNKLGLTGGTMTGSINASGIDNYGATKIRGTFDAVDAVNFNVPTYTTTTNNNAVASTQFVQDRLASGQSVGANAASATKWNSEEYAGATNTNPTGEVMAFNGTTLKWNPTPIGTLTAGLAPATGSSNYIQNNATTTPQSASLNVDGKIRITSGSGPILSTGIEIGAVGTNLVGITAKNASGTLRTLRVEGANISLNGAVTSVNDFTTNAGAIFSQGFRTLGNAGINTPPATGINFQVRAGTDQNLGIFSSSDEVAISAFDDAVGTNKPMRLFASAYNFKVGSATFDNAITSNEGGFISSGTQASYNYQDRTTSLNWALYADAGTTRIYNSSAGDVVTISSAGNVNVTGNVTANNLTSGIYTPTVTMGLGLTSNTAHTCHYTRVGNEVTVHGWIEVTASSLSGNTYYSITLPVASNMTSSDDLSGVGQFISSGQGTTKVMGDAANDKAIISVSVQAGVPLPSYFSFTYTIK